MGATQARKWQDRKKIKKNIDLYKKKVLRHVGWSILLGVADFSVEFIAFYSFFGCLAAESKD